MKKILITTILFIFSVVSAFATPVPDTGQTKCYDNQTEITCPQPGEPFYGQDANYSINPHSYTDLGNGIVRDNVTGLEWQQATAPGTYTWQQALGYCDGLSLGGHDDWRLPNRNELRSIVDYSTHSPAIDTTYFTDTPTGYLAPYWASTTFAYGTGYAWHVYFGKGFVYSYDKSNYLYVRAVRAGQCGSFGDSD